MLKVEDLRTRYGHIEALRGVSLEVKAGEIVTLIGANGAGKTTLLKTLCGVLSPATGRITYAGERLERRPPAQRVRRGLVLVPEGRMILRRMTVHENLLMGTYARSDLHRVADELEEVYTTFPILRERRRASASVLSGGEQQMLAIGRALMAKPRLLMLDEPSLGLAPLVVKEIFRIIGSLRQQRITILLVEQNALQALKLADRGYVMELGRIVMADTAKELLHSERLGEAYLGGSPKGSPATESAPAEPSLDGPAARAGG
ncbi:MAG: ABC transporter ATP-binding protein [Candidatus Tectomicrobia bacterium]|nr:ABC transporter ATP-binding protein [Candidatus Tectomicrobia bacterium]